MSEPVSISFFSSAIRLLARNHGNKTGTIEQYEELRAALGMAEAVFKKMRPVEPKQRKAKT